MRSSYIDHHYMRLSPSDGTASLEGEHMFGRVTRVLLCTGLLVTVLAPAGTAQEDPPTTLRVAMNGYENNITPFTTTGATGRPDDLVMMIYDSLFWSQVKAEPEPWLAEKAESAEGGKVWTVTLREGVTWQDGRPFTPDDVAFSYDYYKKQGASSGRYAHHVSDIPAYDRAEIIDKKTIKLFFSSPAPQFKIMPGADLPIIAKHIFEGVADPGKSTTALPIGTGPFKLVKIDPDQRYILEANPQ